MVAIFKSSLQNLSPLPDLKLSPLTYQFHGLSCSVKSTKFKTLGPVSQRVSDLG